MTSILGWWAEIETESGAIQSTLKRAKISATGSASPAGAIVSTNKRVTINAIGTQTLSGVMGASLKKPTGSFAVSNEGAISASVKKTIASINAKQTYSGAIGSALKKAVAAIAGSQKQTGTIAVSAKKAKASATGVLPGITVNSISAGNANTANGNTLTTNISINIANGANRVVYVGILTTHTTWINPTFSASSNIGTDGSTPAALTEITSIGYGDAGGGFRSANLAVFKLVNPAVGTHTITLRASASQQLLNLCGGAICLNGVGTEGTPVTQLSTNSNAAVNISSAAAIPVGDEVLCFSGVGGTPTWGAGNPTPFFTQTPESNTLAGFNTDGAGAVVTYTSTTSNHKVGSILIPISKA